MIETAYQNDCFEQFQFRDEQMKKITLLLLLLSLASFSIGCSGSQDIVEPSRENFNTGEVTIEDL